jgi:ABC-type glycerol-3-phosphate transport system substrate-binding protein
VLNADWFPAAANLARVENDLYGLPAAMDAVVMVKQAGSVDAGYVPMDYAVGLADSFVFPAGSSNTLIPMILYQSGGGSFFDESGEITIDEDILLETFSKIDSFRRNRLFPDDLINLNSEGDAWASFVSGEYESIFTWASRPLAERNSYSLMHFPGLGEEPFTYARGWVWCLVEQNDLNKEVGLALLDHMTGEDFLRNWSQESNYLPVRSSSLVGLDEQTNAKLSEILNSAVEIPPEQTVKEVKDDIINGMQDVFVGTKSPQAAVEEISQNLIGENE